MVRERLIFKGVSEIVGTQDLALLILTDQKEERQISIVCDRAIAMQIEMRLKSVPITRIMLPEVLVEATKIMQVMDFELIIENIADGQYSTYLYNVDVEQYTQIRASDAVLLSLIAGVPIYIEAGLMMRQSVPYNANAQGVTIPVNTISDEMLQKALDKAIADENYELASHLRDEKIKRKKADEASKN